MEIEKKILRIWRKKLKPSDYLKIYKEYNVAPETVRRALKNGRCIQGTFDKINHYLFIKETNERQMLNSIMGDK